MSNVKQIVISINGLFWSMKTHREVDIDIDKISFDGFTKECLDEVEAVLRAQKK